MSEVVEIAAHGASYRIETTGGGVIGRALAHGVPYEAKVLEHIYRRRHAEPERFDGGVAVDVGAHVGNHTLWFAVVCGLRTIAVEPLTPQDLDRNVELNDLAVCRVEIWPFALGDRDGTAGTSGKGRVRGDGEIPVRRLDDQDLGGRVVLLKVDVEGMEAEVLEGADATIRRDRPVIYVECWDGDARDRVAEILEPLGYTHRRTFGATPLLEWDDR